MEVRPDAPVPNVPPPPVAPPVIATPPPLVPPQPAALAFDLVPLRKELEVETAAIQREFFKFGLTKEIAEQKYAAFQEKIKVMKGVLDEEFKKRGSDKGKSADLIGFFREIRTREQEVGVYFQNKLIQIEAAKAAPPPVGLPSAPPPIQPPVAPPQPAPQPPASLSPAPVPPPASAPARHADPISSPPPGKPAGPTPAELAAQKLEQQKQTAITVQEGFKKQADDFVQKLSDGKISDDKLQTEFSALQNRKDFIGRLVDGRLIMSDAGVELSGPALRSSGSYGKISADFKRADAVFKKYKEEKAVASQKAQEAAAQQAAEAAVKAADAEKLAAKEALVAQFTEVKTALRLSNNQFDGAVKGGDPKKVDATYAVYQAKLKAYEAFQKTDGYKTLQKDPAKKDELAEIDRQKMRTKLSYEQFVDKNKKDEAEKAKLAAQAAAKPPPPADVAPVAPADDARAKRVAAARARISAAFSGVNIGTSLIDRGSTPDITDQRPAPQVEQPAPTRLRGVDREGSVGQVAIIDLGPPPKAEPVILVRQEEANSTISPAGSGESNKEVLDQIMDKFQKGKEAGLQKIVEKYKIKKGVLSFEVIAKKEAGATSGSAKLQLTLTGTGVSDEAMAAIKKIIPQSSNIPLTDEVLKKVFGYSNSGGFEMSHNENKIHFSVDLSLDEVKTADL